MANTNSSTSLYTFQSNVKVSPNNFTTLYNSKPGSVTTGNVGDRNFTTLYTQQSDIKPTRPYGNSNVESFLNVGHDSGGNTVQNINMSGNITVAQQSFLGSVSNVHIEGGNSGYVLTTNGLGNLIWAETQTGGNSVPYIHFDVATTGNNQQFTNTQLSTYANSNVMNVMKNGVNIEPFYYEKVSANVLQVNIQLHAGDTIDVLAEGSPGGAGTPGGYPNTVQYNNGYQLAGSNSFTYIDTTDTLNVGHIVANGSQLSDIVGSNVVGDVSGSNHANIADVANSVSGSNVVGDVSGSNHANIADVANSVSVGNVVGLGNIATINLNGSTTDVLYGNGVWANALSSVAGGSNTQLQYNNNGVLGGTSSLTFNNITGNLSGSFGNINVSTGFTSTGDVIIQRAFEKFSTNVSAATGTINYDVLTQSILYYSSNAAANFTLNIRGNVTTSLNSILPVGDTITVVFLNTVGATAYVANQIQIDGTNVTPKWVNGSAPTVGSRLTNAEQTYTLTIMKTGSATYNILGALGEFQ